MASEELIERAGRALAAAAPPKSRIILFGSHARGNAGPDSDLDLLVIERGHVKSTMLNTALTEGRLLAET